MVGKLNFSIDKSDLDKIKNKLNKVNPSLRPKTLFDAMNNAGALINKKLKENVSNKILKRRSGRLANSINHIVSIINGSITAIVGSGVGIGKRVKYANILETGGVITAKRSRYLTIPLPRALTKAGVLKGGNTSARDFSNTFIKRSKAGNLIIFQKQGKNSIVPLFVLKHSVSIPAKRYMSNTLDRNKSQVISMIDSTIEKALR